MVEDELHMKGGGERKRERESEKLSLTVSWIFRKSTSTNRSGNFHC